MIIGVTMVTAMCIRTATKERLTNNSSLILTNNHYKVGEGLYFFYTFLN